MESLSRPKLYTQEDLDRLPEDWRVELVEGELVMAPSPVPWHQVLVRRLLLELCAHLGPGEDERVLPAPLDVRVDTHNVYQPDLMVLPEGTRPTGIDWEMPAPVWVAEVISPYTGRQDLKKLPFYARQGVTEAWLIYPGENRIEIHDLIFGSIERLGGGDRATSRTLPGFGLDLERFFHA